MAGGAPWSDPEGAARDFQALKTLKLNGKMITTHQHCKASLVTRENIIEHHRASSKILKKMQFNSILLAVLVVCHSLLFSLSSSQHTTHTLTHTHTQIPKHIHTNTHAGPSARARRGGAWNGVCTFVY
jgi:hypothetical protein